MPVFETTVDCPLADSFRVQQVAGMFDLPLADKLQQSFAVELPSASESWQIGAIVGPSGSGKSTIARRAFGSRAYCRGHRWQRDRAVIDGFGRHPIREILNTLCAVGFSTPPSWVRPYRVLSDGERFRCDLARALLSRRRLVVFDEFTSVVDRTVAQVASAAVAKAIRRNTAGRQFVAVTCHHDVLEWLSPDWVLDTATGELSRRRLRRPSIRLEIFSARQRAWRVFSRHHYLNPRLSPFCTCYLATRNGRPVAFAGILPQAGRRGWRRISRLVVLPDNQGIGIGGRFLNALARLLSSDGYQVTITTGHPAMIALLDRSTDWTVTKVSRTGNRHTSDRITTDSWGRAVVSAAYAARMN